MYKNELNNSTVKHGSATQLVMGILSVVSFVIGHVYGSSIFLYIGVIMMAANFALFSDDLLCYELLYIPLVAILKLSPDGASLLSYISLIGIVIFLMKRKSITIDISIIFIFLSLLVLFLFKEIFQQFGITMVYIKLLITMVSTAVFIKLKLSDPRTTAEEMRKANLFLTCGVIMASIIGYTFADNAYLSRFMTVESSYIGEELISRFCGVSADSNYYSSLVIFAIATNLFQFIYRPHISHIIYTIILAIFGVLSLSKMFLLLLATIVLLFVFAWIKTKGALRAKNIVGTIVIVLCLGVGLYFILKSPAVQLILVRMGGSSDLNEFTTGRSDAWTGYIRALWTNIEYLLIGTDSNSAIVGVHVTHNTILQTWWKLGVFGVILVLSWFVYAWNKCKKRNVGGSVMLFIGCIGATMALDMLFFEQLFWFFVFYVLCKQVSNKKSYDN